MSIRITDIEEKMNHSESDAIIKADEICGQGPIQWACEILRKELLKHGDLYNAFACSIESSLREQFPFQPEAEAADKILKRIIGEE